MSSVFRFKQFSVQQEHSAMKVGTDGVLLGAWVNCREVLKIADIGCGTGLISLMLAQRHQQTEIWAVEIDAGAVLDAAVNFNHSPWESRIHLVHTDMQSFENSDFDLVVSNPPFFVKSLKNIQVSRITARHDDLLSFEQLLDFTINTHSRKLAVIYPFDRLVDIEITTQQRGWHINRKCVVYPNLHKTPVRVMLEISMDDVAMEEEQLIIEENGRHSYSQAYIDLTKAFYLNM